MRTLLILAPLVLAACNGQPAQNAAAPAATTTENYQAQVAALGQAERNAVFIRAIRDAGFDCQQVTGSEARGDGATWTATCSGGASYGVVIGRDGTAQVVGARS